MLTAELSKIMIAFTLQARVIHALILREILTRYGRHNIGFMWVFLENLLFTSAVVAFWTASHGSNMHGFELLPFTVLGYSFVLAWRNIINRSVKAIEPNRSLLYHRQVKIIDIYLARIGLEVIASTGAFIFACIFLGVLGYMNLPKDIGLLVLGWILLITVSTSLALIVGPLTEISEMFERIWHILTYLLFPLSGAFVAVDWLPSQLRDVFLLIPLVHVIEIIRVGYYGSNYVAHYDFLYLLGFILSSLALGLMLIKHIEINIVVE